MLVRNPCLAIVTSSPITSSPTLCRRKISATPCDHAAISCATSSAAKFRDMNPADALHNVQTVTVPAGGGGVFDVKIDQPGLYPFVSHAFAAVDQGQVGLLNVGNVEGTMSH